ncbi:hypothetical protein ETAA8_03240 [Anatilimnocola aggregata]|uniref:Lipoprotein n=1 Tax=Anatilimnocola aggregata TaxID=2528021 RepID=A0A517Y4Z4_9BACT|nr:hypothetical protein [Anatilimnocola aggregata]QDU25260.1 hypothetical protein ETAA8_03240 [Anatilimnocola aggregata]
MAKSSLRSSQFSLSLLLLFMSLISVAVYGCKLLSSYIHVQDVPVAVANDKLRMIGTPFSIPDTATHCSVSGRFYSYFQATYQIDQVAFLKSTADRFPDIRRPEPIPFDVRTSLAYNFKPLGHGDIQQNAHGYVLNTMTMRGGWRIVYDATEQRAYVEYSPR